HAGLIASEWHEWMSSRLDMAIGAGVLAVGIAIPLGFLLVRRIVSPLDELAAVMHRFAEGKLDVRSPVRRHDEIGRLVTVFNRMADLHQQTHERIVRLNTTLEKRVSQRTRQLRELAARDPLTGLYNRRHFNEVLKRSMSEALRYDNGLSCLMIDLDDFKAVNDAFGHQVGDEVLVLMASTITSQLRAADVAARYGGDEFVVLLPQTETDQARVLGERIMERFSENIGMCLPKVRASLSVGIASVQLQRAFSADSLLRAADRALYSAKAAGRSCIITASEAEDHPGACPPAAQFRG
ncbi:MAG: diguanylate cyclase, partial [Planctomycetes bacterium]|nr:diguanylate cyclase [Planctomycetota bacterium]